MNEEFNCPNFVEVCLLCSGIRMPPNCNEEQCENAITNRLTPGVWSAGDLYNILHMDTYINKLISVGHDIVVMSTFHSLIRHRGHHDGCRRRSRKCL